MTSLKIGVRIPKSIARTTRKKIQGSNKSTQSVLITIEKNLKQV